MQAPAVNGLRDNQSKRIAWYSLFLQVATWVWMLGLVFFTFKLLQPIASIPADRYASGFLSLVSVQEVVVSSNLLALHSPMTLAAKLTFFAYFLSSALWHLFCLFLAQRLFGNFRKSGIFTVENVKLVRLFGWALLVGFVFKWIVYFVIVQLQMHFMPLENHSFGDISVASVIEVVPSIMAIVAAWLLAIIMGVGSQLDSDIEHTI